MSARENVLGFRGVLEKKTQSLTDYFREAGKQHIRYYPDCVDRSAEIPIDCLEILTVITKVYIVCQLAGPDLK